MEKDFNLEPLEIGESLSKNFHLQWFAEDEEIEDNDQLNSEGDSEEESDTDNEDFEDERSADEILSEFLEENKNFKDLKGILKTAKHSRSLISDVKNELKEKEGLISELQSKIGEHNSNNTKKETDEIDSQIKEIQDRLGYALADDNLAKQIVSLLQKKSDIPDEYKDILSEYKQKKDEQKKKDEFVKLQKEYDDVCVKALNSIAKKDSTFNMDEIKVVLSYLQEPEGQELFNKFLLSDDKKKPAVENYEKLIKMTRYIIRGIESDKREKIIKKELSQKYQKNFDRMANILLKAKKGINLKGGKPPKPTEKKKTSWFDKD